MQKKFAGYENLNLLSEGARAIVYRAESSADRSSVVLKILKSEFPTPEDVAIFQRESDLLSQTTIEGIPRLKHFENKGRDLFLVLDSSEGESLDKIIQRGPLALPDFLDLAEKILTVLSAIHRCQIIHRDIKPHNIVFDSRRQKIEIIDFGLAIRFDSHMGQSQNLCGTLEYLSPEQTGRLNRHVDHRTDIYSLGVTFYEMLTGQKPFAGRDALELVHAHIALAPPHLCLARPELPTFIDKIISKMLRKTPADRYQTAGGVYHDLIKFRQMLACGNTNVDFELGTDDLSENFIIPAKVYGREKQLAELSEAFLAATRGEKKFFLVDGPPGIGKSALVRELSPWVAEHKAWMISGKYDQHHRDVPFSGFVQAFGSLVRQILSEPPEKLAEISAQFKIALGDEGGVLTGLIPHLELILGPQAVVPAMGATENRERFVRVFSAFLQAIAARGQTLVLFLDDMQWADGGSRQLLQHVLNDPRLAKTLVVTAIRGQEVGAHHPWRTFMEELKSKGLPFSEIQMTNLQSMDIVEMLLDTLHCEASRAEPLAELLVAKTGGNPFFIHQFLRRLYEKSLFRFDRGWQWDERAMLELEATTNVLDLLIEKISQLPENAKRLICTAAGLTGNTFGISDLVAIGTFTDAEARAAAEQALCAGLIALREEDSYRFVHDRIQEAAYGLLPPEQREEVHYKFGQLLLKIHSGPKLEENIFQIVHHLNQSLALIKTDDERRQLAEWNRIAMTKARQSLSNESVLLYAKKGLEILGHEDWELNEEQLNDFYCNIAETQALLHDNDNALETIQYVIQKSQALDLKTRAYNRYSRILQAKVDYPLMEKYVLEALAANKIYVSQNPTFALARNILALLFYFTVRGTGPLYRVPKKVPEELDEVFTHGSVAGTGGGPKMLMFFVTLQLRRMLKTGHLESTGPALMAFAMMVFNSLRMTRLGIELVEAGFHFDRMYEPLILRGWADTIYGCFISPRRDPFEKSIVHMVKGLQLGGEVRYKGFFMLINLLYQMYGWLTSGKNLKKVLEEIDNLEPTVRNVAMGPVFCRWTDAREFINLMMGEPVLHPPAQGKEFESTDNLPRAIAWRATMHMWRNTLLGDYPAAAKNLEEMQDYLKSTPSFGWGFSLFHLCQPIVLARLYPSATARERRRTLRKIKKNEKVLRRWSANSSVFTPYHEIVRGERLRLKSRFADAEQAFHRALETAAEQGNAFLEAQAQESLAELMHEMGRPLFFRLHAREALKTYAYWGANAKVEGLKKRWGTWGGGHLNTESRTLSAMTSTHQSATLGPLRENGLDVASIMKSSAALSEEIEMGNLISRLTWILTENAGAERCVLLAGTNPQNLRVIAESVAAKGEGSVPIDKPLAGFTEIPQSVILFAARSQESLVLACAITDATYLQDPYVQEKNVQSVLCLPMINKGQLKGIVYLEHRSAAEVFDVERIKVLQILVSQAAISLENARLFQQAGQKARMEAELQTAKTVQETLFPSELADYGYVQLAGIYLGATECGGDLWFHNQMNDETFIWVGDATGHGAPAALITSAARATIATMKYLPGLRPNSAMTVLNSSIFECSKSRLNMTFFVGAIPPNGRMVFSSAAQPEPFHISAQLVCDLRAEENWDKIKLSQYRKKIVALDSDAAELLGQNEVQEFKSYEVPLGTGDYLILYSDGIIELENEAQEQWGRRRFQFAIIEALRTQSSLESTRNFILEKIHEFRGRRELQDDITLVVLRYSPR